MLVGFFFNIIFWFFFGVHEKKRSIMEHYLWYAHKKALKYVIHSAVCNLYKVFFFAFLFGFKLSAEYKKKTI